MLLKNKLDFNEFQHNNQTVSQNLECIEFVFPGAEIIYV